jgi:hypothetical protein
VAAFLAAPPPALHDDAAESLRADDAAQPLAPCSFNGYASRAVRARPRCARCAPHGLRRGRAQRAVRLVPTRAYLCADGAFPPQPLQGAAQLA